jgi:hypothetical protein
MDRAVEFSTNHPEPYNGAPVQELDPTDPRDHDAPGCVGNLNHWTDEVRPR